MSYKRGDSAQYALSQTQAKAVLAACADTVDKVIIGLQLFCTMRVGEVVHFNASWITATGDLKIPERQKCGCAVCARHPKHAGTWTPKTKAGARTLPIPKQLRKDLSTLLKVKPYGLGLSRQSIWLRTKAILKKARVKFKGTAGNTGFPHCLRATCASMLVEGGMNEFHLCYLLGWADINMAKHYVQLFRVKPKALQAAKDIFG